MVSISGFFLVSYDGFIKLSPQQPLKEVNKTDKSIFFLLACSSWLRICCFCQCKINTFELLVEQNKQARHPELRKIMTGMFFNHFVWVIELQRLTIINCIDKVIVLVIF